MQERQSSRLWNNMPSAITCHLPYEVYRGDRTFGVDDRTCCRSGCLHNILLTARSLPLKHCVGQLHTCIAQLQVSMLQCFWEAKREVLNTDEDNAYAR
jgi:hypothetical protein